MKSKRLLSTEIFIQRAKEKHGELYDYSKVDYCGMTKKVTILCKIHGAFQQCAGNHLREEKLKQMGYKIVTIWETDWNSNSKC